MGNKSSSLSRKEKSSTPARQPSTMGPSADKVDRTPRDQDREQLRIERQQQAEEHTRRREEQQQARKPPNQDHCSNTANMSTSIPSSRNKALTAAQQPSVNSPTNDADQSLRDQDRERQKLERQQQTQEHTRRWKEQQEVRKLQKQGQLQQYTRSNRQCGSDSWEKQEIARLCQRVLQLEDRLQKARKSHRKQVDDLEWQILLQDFEYMRKMTDQMRQQSAEFKGVLRRLDMLSEEFQEGLAEFEPPSAA